ncbi:MAG: NCS2 family permease [Bacteroidales bacterium]|nr:NCS2 family permease [Bacteroidales bacterium]
MMKKLFGFEKGVHKVRTEIVAGVTTFLTMAYILAVNPGIFSALSDLGMPTPSVFTATALAALVGTLVMAFYAKKPFGLAPGMGLNAFFVFTVCLGMGYTWQFALTAILIEGIIFILLTLTKVRELIVNSIPADMKKAISAGIGLFIAFIGLKNCNIIVANDATFVGLGNLGDATAILAIITFVITGALLVLRVKGALLIGIVISTLIGLPMGLTNFGSFSLAVPSIKPIFCQFAWSQILSWDMLVVVMTFLFIDMFDTIGTVVGVSMKAGMVDKDGKVDGVNRILMADAVATTAGACLGTSTTTTYVESAAGVSEGGRTGLTALVVACCFALALPFSSFFLAIPAAATGAVLVLVGVMMASSIGSINFSDMDEAIPSFMTMLLMPLCYSISDGIMIGVITYVVLHLLSFKKETIKKISPTMAVLAVLFIAKYVIAAIN